ncbi:beta-phosphoglucomutase [Peribacillus sp. SI8-4]|uniref:beta-phosphoglucomutase n=1 Tax=Peribacillus sp. SI8-4 TaxID=3048009 RepID=UPI002552A523|nr:beta-phosphoglucomutase [Peribacillus sp. SI8-4]
MDERFIDAVVFDLDGVITDTAHYHFLAWRQLAHEMNIEIDEVFNERLKGVSRMASLELILEEGNRQNDFTLHEKESMAEKKNQHYCQFLNHLTPQDILPGIVELISAIKKEGVPIGLASVSKNALTVLRALQLDNTFDYIVDASKVKKSKPDPEIFLTACNRLEANPERSIGIEDAAAGIDSIKASKMFAVGVGNTLYKSDYQVTATKGLKWENIKAEYQNWRNRKTVNVMR